MNNKKETNEKWIVRILSFFVVILIFSIGFILGRSGFDESVKERLNIGDDTGSAEVNIDFTLFWDVWDFVKDNYVDSDISDEDLFYGAIKGMVAGIDDPATNFFTKEETDEYELEKSGTLEGIGIEMSYMVGEVVIKRIFPDTPAEDSDLEIGDTIRKVDDEDTAELTISEVAEKIRGEANTDVKISIYREKTGEDKTFTITRKAVHISSISWEMVDDEVAFITLRRFTEDSPQAFYDAWDQAVSEISLESPKGIIIDLRGNPGGYVSGATYVAGEFLERGDVVMYERGRDGVENARSVDRDGSWKDIPVVILIDSSTASASEIFAGALQYYDRAVLIGKSTYGKGTAQEVLVPDEWDGASIHITIQKWLLPDKKWLNPDDPINPDIEVVQTMLELINGEDPQQVKALETIKSKF